MCPFCPSLPVSAHAYILSPPICSVGFPVRRLCSLSVQVLYCLYSLKCMYACVYVYVCVGRACIHSCGRSWCDMGVCVYLSEHVPRSEDSYVELILSLQSSGLCAWDLHSSCCDGDSLPGIEFTSSGLFTKCLYPLSHLVHSSAVLKHMLLICVYVSDSHTLTETHRVYLSYSVSCRVTLSWTNSGLHQLSGT